MKLPRFLHRWYSLLFGYFWLPCPICEEYFGGHEIKNCRTATVHFNQDNSRIVCPDPLCNYYAGVISARISQVVFIPQAIVRRFKQEGVEL